MHSVTIFFCSLLAFIFNSCIANAIPTFFHNRQYLFWRYQFHFEIYIMLCTYELLFLSPKVSLFYRSLFFRCANDWNEWETSINYFQEFFIHSKLHWINCNSHTHHPSTIYALDKIVERVQLQLILQFNFELFVLKVFVSVFVIFSKWNLIWNMSSSLWPVKTQSNKVNKFKLRVFCVGTQNFS